METVNDADRTCATCRFYRADWGEWEWSESDPTAGPKRLYKELGKCFLRPPVVVTQQAYSEESPSRVYCDRPDVEEKDFCGEWRFNPALATDPKRRNRHENR